MIVSLKCYFNFELVQDTKDAGIILIKQVLFCKMVKNFKKMVKGLEKKSSPPKFLVRQKVLELSGEIKNIYNENKKFQKNEYGILYNNEFSLNELDGTVKKNNKTSSILPDKNENKNFNLFNDKQENQINSKNENMNNKQKGKYVIKKIKEKKIKKMQKEKEKEERYKEIEKMLSEAASSSGVLSGDIIKIEDFANLNESEDNFNPDEEDANMLLFYKHLEGSLKDLKL